MTSQSDETRVSVEPRHQEAAADLLHRLPGLLSVRDYRIADDAFARFEASLQHSGKVATGVQDYRRPLAAMKAQTLRIRDTPSTDVSSSGGEVERAVADQDFTPSDWATELAHKATPETWPNDTYGLAQWLDRARIQTIHRLDQLHEPSRSPSSSGGMNGADVERLLEAAQRIVSIAPYWSGVGTTLDKTEALAELRAALRPDAAVSVGMPTREEIEAVLRKHSNELYWSLERGRDFEPALIDDLLALRPTIRGETE